MPLLVWAMASGFVGDERFDLAVLFGRIAFSYILFITLVALLSGVLNAFGRFTEASFVPVLMNLMFIAAMLMADRCGWDMGLTLAWTVPATGIAQLAFTWISAHRAGFHFTPRLATADARTETSGDHRRAGGAGGWAWCRSTCWWAVRSPALPKARWRGFPMPTGFINCPWAWWQRPSALCCCPICRAACARAMRRAGASRLIAARNLRCS